MIRLENKIVWITGASSGIGEALAYKLAGEKVKLIISARREDELKRVAAQTKLNENDFLILPLDLEKNNAFKTEVEKAIQKFGRIDMLINNAGMGQRSKALETKPEVDRKIMEINFFGTIALTKEVCLQMKKQGSGQIVTVTSIIGKMGMPLFSTYSASKHALNGYFESLREEVIKDNIKVQIVCPGFINTQVGPKSLAGDGTVSNVISPALNKGMKADVCARKIISFIKKPNRKHKFVGRYEIYSVYFKQLFPNLFYWLMRKIKPE